MGVEMDLPSNLQEITEYRCRDSNLKVMTIGGSARSRKFAEARECVCFVQLKQLPKLIVRSTVIINFGFEQAPVVSFGRTEETLPREWTLAIVGVWRG
jgi:hypothetical protein